jgi:hypothetical protein
MKGYRNFIRQPFKIIKATLFFLEHEMSMSSITRTVIIIFMRIPSDLYYRHSENANEKINR